MKPSDYIRCPRCELNFIQRKDKYCSVCQAEMNADPSSYDELDMETCPICKTNFIRPDEIMCSQCAKERSLNGDNAIGIDDDWETYLDGEEEENSSLDEETGDMASVTDLENDDLEDIESDDLSEMDEEFDIEDEEVDDEEYNNDDEFDDEEYNDDDEFDDEEDF